MVIHSTSASTPPDPQRFVEGATYYELIHTIVNGRRVPVVHTWLCEGVVHHDCSTASPNPENCSYRFRLIEPAGSQSQGETVRLWSLAHAWHCRMLTFDEFCATASNYLEDDEPIAFPFVHETTVQTEHILHYESDRNKVLTALRENLIDSAYFRGRVDEEIFAALASATRLRQLVFSGAEFVESDVCRLATLPHLEDLTISNTASLTDAGLEILGAMSGLRGLHLLNTPLTDEGLQYLHRLHELRSLQLCGPGPAGNNDQVTTQGLSALTSCRKLKILVVWDSGVDDTLAELLPAWQQLEWLTCDRTRAGDAVAEVASRCSRLKILMMRSTAITDAGVRSLEQSKSLRVLYIEDTKVGFRAIRCLKETNPDCYIRR